MDVGVEAETRTQGLQEFVKVGTLPGAESGCEDRFLILRSGPKPGEERAPLARELKVLCPSIGLAADPPDEPFVLETVGERDDPARYGAQPPRERTLREPRTARDDADHAGLGRRDPERTQVFGEQAGSMRTELGEQKADPGGAAGSRHADRILH